MGLLSEITERKKEIITDSYPISIGEIMNMYRDSELDIHPEFQRFFRWTEGQKTKLIESILLGIPIPSLFVSQREDGVWDVIDGVQRLSTIFQFVGLLKDHNTNPVNPLILTSTEYLPSLGNVTWEQQEGTEILLEEVKLDFKRSKLSFQIIKKESDENMKYELFQRLNSLGSHLSDQELRNCVLVMIKPEFYQALQDLSQHETYSALIAVSDQQLLEGYDMDLALRFIVFSLLQVEQLPKGFDVNNLLSAEMKTLALSNEFSLADFGNHFRLVFDLLLETFGEPCFRRYDSQQQKFKGGFLISLYEVLAIGLSKALLANLDRSPQYLEHVRDRARALVREITGIKEYRDNSGSGVRASQRVPKMIEIGAGFFAQ